MKQHDFASHTPAESRRLSNLGHVVEGALLGIVGVLAVLSGLGIAPWAATAWPVLMFAAGIVLLVLIYPRHPFADWRAIWGDRLQRQHTLMAAGVAVAGAAELFRSKGEAWAYVWPAVACVIGAMFISHEQHGTSEAAARALLRHRILGLTIIAAGLLRAVEVSTANGLLAILWPLALLGGAAQLFLYREPEGAFEPGDTHGGH